jgi:hypothetical protein
MVYLTITFSEELCKLRMYQENPNSFSNNITWCSDPPPPLLYLDPFNKIRVVEYYVGQFSLPVEDKGCLWCIIDRRSGENDVPEKSSASRTLETLTVKDGMLDVGKATLLTTFLSGVVQVENCIKYWSLLISPGVNIGHLPFTRMIECYECPFEAGSCFFKRPSSPSLHRNYRIGKELFDLELSFNSCRMPDELDVSFLQDIPRIALNVSHSKDFSMTLLKILQSQLVKVVVHIKIDSLSMLELYVASCCAFLEKSTVLTYFFCKFHLPLNVNRNVHMDSQQQKKIFDAAGNAASPVLHSLQLFCDDAPPFFFHQKRYP